MRRLARYLHTARGFTLVETLVAVLMLTLSIAGPLSIASKGISATLVAKDQFIAFYLAQDAMEHIRFLRDSACLASAGDSTGCPRDVWLSSLSLCTSADGSAVCNIDSIQNVVCTQGTANCAAIMNYNTTNYYYSYTTGTLSSQQFIRSIRITHDPAGSAPDEAVVSVTVSWRGAAGITPAPITVRENLLRWQ